MQSGAAHLFQGMKLPGSVRYRGQPLRYSSSVGKCNYQHLYILQTSLHGQALFPEPVQQQEDLVRQVGAVVQELQWQPRLCGHGQGRELSRREIFQCQCRPAPLNGGDLSAHLKRPPPFQSGLCAVLPRWLRRLHQVLIAFSL